MSNKKGRGKLRRAPLVSMKLDYETERRSSRGSIDPAILFSNVSLTPQQQAEETLRRDKQKCAEYVERVLSKKRLDLRTIAGVPRRCQTMSDRIDLRLFLPEWSMRVQEILVHFWVSETWLECFRCWLPYLGELEDRLQVMLIDAHDMYPHKIQVLLQVLSQHYPESFFKVLCQRCSVLYTRGRLSQELLTSALLLVQLFCETPLSKSHPNTILPMLGWLLGFGQTREFVLGCFVKLIQDPGWDALDAFLHTITFGLDAKHACSMLSKSIQNAVQLIAILEHTHLSDALTELPSSITYKSEVLALLFVLWKELRRCEVDSTYASRYLDQSTELALRSVRGEDYAMEGTLRLAAECLYFGGEEEEEWEEIEDMLDLLKTRTDDQLVRHASHVLAEYIK